MKALSITVATVAAAISIALVPTVAFADDTPVEDTAPVTEETTQPEAPVEEAPEVETPDPTPTTEAPASWTPASWEDYNVEYVTLDCTTATFIEHGTHAWAWEVAPGVWPEEAFTEPFSRFGGDATGGSENADCPNWVTDEDGNWYNSDITEPVVVTTPSDEETSDTTEASEQPELKIGLARPARAFGGLGR